MGSSHVVFSSSIFTVVVFDSFSKTLECHVSIDNLDESSTSQPARQNYELTEKEKLRLEPITLETLTGANVTFDESCPCGATCRSSWPAQLVERGTKYLNTWRKFHSCSLRSSSNEIVEKPEWLLKGLGETCVACHNPITEFGPEWWRIDGQWAHLDCVTCQMCGRPARHNGAMAFVTGNRTFQHRKCPVQ